MTATGIRNRVPEELYRLMPVSVAVIDPQYRIVEANGAFLQTFGAWTGHKCHEVMKRSDSPCSECGAVKTFSDGEVRVERQSGLDRHGNPTGYTVRVIPLTEEDGSIPYVIEMVTEITIPGDINERYEILFDKTPCYISIIDRRFQVIQANQKFRETFGEPGGRFCHQLYKQRPEICGDCPALRVFETGEEHSSRQVGVDIQGHATHYIVTATPLTKTPDGAVETVMEIAVDVTRVADLESRLKQTFDIQETVIRSSMDALIVTDESGAIIIFNPAAEKIFGYKAEEVIGRRDMADRIVPGEFINMIVNVDETFHFNETAISNRDGEEVPVRLAGSILKSGGGILGSAFFVQDLRDMKKLEDEKLTAERLAAVGQTVSGLAHGIKNIVTGLEGGLYVMQTGLRKSDIAKITKGLGMLEGNIERISHFVKEFLNFARGRVPDVEMAGPNDIAREVFELYNDAAAKIGVTVFSEFQPGIAPAPMDRESIHTCLSNLVSNAIDACRMSDKKQKNVTLRTADRNETIVFEVADNGIGMDCEVKRKVFTSFFSTKGSHEGTGIGLLLTKKTIQEHGGSVRFDSKPGEGSIFSLELPRNRLPKPNGADRAAAPQGDQNGR